MAVSGVHTTNCYISNYQVASEMFSAIIMQEVKFSQLLVDPLTSVLIWSIYNSFSGFGCLHIQAL